MTSERAGEMLAPLFALLTFSSPPGSYDPAATRAVICAAGYARSHRAVAYGRRDAVYAAYGLPRGSRRGFVIDHFIPLELGGSNDRANLWPQPLAEARRKDRDEDRLRAAVCTGSMSLDAARAQMRRLWRRSAATNSPRALRLRSLRGFLG